MDEPYPREWYDNTEAHSFAFRKSSCAPILVVDEGVDHSFMVGVYHSWYRSDPFRGEQGPGG